MITDEKLGEALELISKGITRPTKIAKAMGITYRSYCQWMVRNAPFAQQIRLLEGAFPDLRRSQTINQNINGAVEVGVGFAPKVDYSAGPPAVPPPPPRPALPAPVDAEFSEVDAELEYILG